MKSISSTRKPGRGDYVVFSTIMEIKCDYNQLGSFISKIENAQPHIRIESITLAGGEARLSVGRRGKSRLPETQPEDDVAASVNLAVETYSLRK